MDTNLITLDKKNIEFTDAAGMVAAYLWMENAKGALKDMAEKWQLAATELFKSQPDLKEVEIGPDIVMYCSRDKKEKFQTQKIYDLFKFTPEQQCILERNPGFRKNELKKITGIEDVEAEFMDVEFTDVVKVKTLNKKYLK